MTFSAIEPFGYHIASVLSIALMFYSIQKTKQKTNTLIFITTILLYFISISAVNENSIWIRVTPYLLLALYLTRNHVTKINTMNLNRWVVLVILWLLVGQLAIGFGLLHDVREYLYPLEFDNVWKSKELILEGGGFRDFRLSGWLYNPNQNGKIIFLLMATYLTLKYAGEKQTFIKIISNKLIIVSMISILATGSRTYLALSILYLITLNKNKKINFALVVPLVSYLFINYILLGSADDTNNTLLIKIELITNLMRESSIYDFLFGFNISRHMDSDIGMVFLSSGFIGLVLFSLLILVIYYGSNKNPILPLLSLSTIVSTPFLAYNSMILIFLITILSKQNYEKYNMDWSNNQKHR